MTRTTGRVLRLLTLLQGRRVWTSGELSERLRVDARTIRRDVDRLRELGYVIEASSGPGGGYRLGAGNATPPLLLEDEEAVAVAASLGAAAGSVSGAHEVALRVLVKLNQLLPARLRHRLSALQAVTVPLVAGQPMADPFALTAIAEACQDRQLLHFSYRNRRGEVTERSVEPERLVHTGRVWYLVAWDRAREDWRTFRVDRVQSQPPLTRGARFSPRPPPDDAASFVSRSIAAAPHRYVAHVRLAAPAEEVCSRLPPWLGAPESIDERSCKLTIGAETVEIIAAYIVQAGVDFVLLGPPEIIEPLRAITRRMQRAMDDSSSPVELPEGSPPHSGGLAARAVVGWGPRSYPSATGAASTAWTR
jgi:predicted DNA-binding transcriptional regulator YafY